MGQRSGVGGVGLGPAAESGLESQLPLLSARLKEATTMLHMLTLLKDLLPCFPEGLVKSCSEIPMAGHDLEPCGEPAPQCMGCTEALQSFRPQACVLALGKLAVQAKAGVGASWPWTCSWLHLRTHLIPGVGQTGQPQLGDELGGG